MAERIVRKNYLEYGGRKFHERAEPDAYRMALELAHDCTSGRALDLAAGSGYTTVQLAALGLDVTALDINTDQFVPTEIPCRKVNLNEPLDVPDGSMRLVMALEVIEHLENPRGFVRELGRVLEKDGVLVLSTPNIVSIYSKLRFLLSDELELFFNQANRVNDSFCEEADGHITPVLPWLLDIFLKEAGLSTEKTTYTQRLGMRNRHTGRTMVIRCVKN